MTTRFTRRCIHENYRLPLLTGKEVFLLETDAGNKDIIRKQHNRSVPDAYFGDAINKLGEFEEIGLTPAEICERLEELEKLRKEEGSNEEICINCS